MDESRKRGDLASTPVKDTVTKRLRHDLNSSIIEMQGMSNETVNVDKPESIEDIVKSSVSKIIQQQQQAQGSTSKPKSPNQPGSGVKSASVPDIDELVSSVLKQLIPVVVSAIASAVEASTKAAIASVKSLEVQRIDKMQQLALFAKYDNDKQEQYSRRETIRISGISTDVGDDEGEIIKEVIKIGERIDVHIKPQDISVAHRVGRPNDRSKARPILCKFISRQMKDRMMKSRKALKDMPETKGTVYINEDLTPLRSKLMRYAKDLHNVQRVNSSNGRIHCNLVDGTHVILDNPDDLFKLGVTSIDLEKLGLHHYIID